MRRGKSPRREKSKPENVASVKSEKLKVKKRKKGDTSAAAIKERQDIEYTFKEYPPPPEEHAHELEMEKRLKRLIEERKSEI